MPHLKLGLKRLASWPLKAALNQIDFVKLNASLARLEPGRSFVERTGPPEFAFPDQEDIIRKTVELTLAELKERQDKVNLKDIQDYARSISCRYDHEVHTHTKATVFTASAHLFQQEDLDRLYVSADRRELSHLDVLLKARRDGYGVIYMVNHSTHWDEFLVDVVLEQNQVSLPLFAAGSNMMATPSLGRILMVGSYVILRRGATRNYLRTLFNYCRALSELGQQQGIFLEAWVGGARTRDGSLRYPRRLISLQGALAAERDVLIQPVGISYSLVPEDLVLSERAGWLSWVSGLSYLKWWLRSPHRPLVALSRALKNIYGRAFIHFCPPKFLSELKAMHAQDPAELALDEFVALYGMHEIARYKKVTATQLTARGLVRAQREKNHDLIQAARSELEAVIDYHRRTFGQDPDLEDFIRRHSLEDVVEDGLRTLRRRKIVGRIPRRQGLPQVLAENALHYYATHGDRRLYSPSAKENIVIAGAGMWGFGLACLIGNRTLEERRYLNSSLTLFDSREELVGAILDTRTHPVHFPKARLPKNVFAAFDATAAFRKATDVLITTPADLFESELKLILSESTQPLNVIIVSRGFDQTTHRLPIQIAASLCRQTGRDDVNLLVLSGPVTPNKLAEGLGGALVLAGPPKGIRKVADLFNWPPFTIHVCHDPIGVQAAGVMTEVYSLLGAYLLRTKELEGRVQVAAFFRETSEEVMRLAEALGGQRETFLPDNPAWSAEYLAAGMGGLGASFGRQAARSLARTSASARDFLDHLSRENLEAGQHLIGYTGIRSAYLTAKDLGLELPRLLQAYGIFWKD